MLPDGMRYAWMKNVVMNKKMITATKIERPQSINVSRLIVFLPRASATTLRGFAAVAFRCFAFLFFADAAMSCVRESWTGASGVCTTMRCDG